MKTVIKAGRGVIHDPVLVVVTAQDPRYVNPNGSPAWASSYASRDDNPDEIADELVAKWFPAAIAHTIEVKEL